jgi:hypothetical protein
VIFILVVLPLFRVHGLKGLLNLIIYNIIYVNFTFFNWDQESFYAEAVLICSVELSVDKTDDLEGGPKLSVWAQILTLCFFSFSICPICYPIHGFV